MTREEAKELLPIIQAFAEGKTIQQKRQVGYEDEWFDVNTPSWDKIPSDYRIKPEPKYRPFKTTEECWNEMLKHEPFGWLKNKKSGGVVLISSVYLYEGKEVWLIWATNGKSLSASNLFKDYVFADGEPFGIKEE